MSGTVISVGNGWLHQDGNNFDRDMLPLDFPQVNLMSESYFTSSQDHGTIYDDFDDSDNLEDYIQDSDIIAQANAEALINDMDGFYGNEFDFYAVPHKSGEVVVCENGGYFGPKKSDGLQWSQTGRFGLHEPNLTPITEYSEYSNGNSFISSAIHSPNSMRDINSPGLGQVNDLVSKEENEDDKYDAMIFESILNFRRRAWGADQANMQTINDIYQFLNDVDETGCVR